MERFNYDGKKKSEYFLIGNDKIFLKITEKLAVNNYWHQYCNFGLLI